MSEEEEEFWIEQENQRIEDELMQKISDIDYDESEQNYTIKVRRPNKHIPYLTKNLTLLQARNNLRWILNSKCIDCTEKCSDCYLDYVDKISIEKILIYLDKKLPKRKIKGYYFKRI